MADEMYFGDSIERRQAVLVQLIDRLFSRTERLYPAIPLMGIVRNKLLPSRAQEPYAGRTQCRVSAWFGKLSPRLRRQLTDCEVYEYVEIMP